MVHKKKLSVLSCTLQRLFGRNVKTNDYAHNRQAIIFACYHHPRLRQTHQMSQHGSQAASDVSASAARRTPPTPPPVWELDQVKLRMPLENASIRAQGHNLCSQINQLYASALLVQKKGIINI